MAGTPEPFDELVSHAHDTRVVVVGGGIAGLVAALECAKVGMPVTVLEATSAFGGTIAEADVAGIRVDVGATCWSPAPAMRDLVGELGLEGLVVTPRTDRTWIAGLGRGGAAPVPDDSVLGIPANPWAEDVRPFIGLSGAWRAYLDRLRPPLTIGKERNLATLVRTRMGEPVLTRLVAPLSLGRFGVSPDRVDVGVAAPGLNSALTRTGSLGGGVADVLVDRPADASVESLEAGMLRLVDALVERLTELGAELVLDVRVTGLGPSEDGRWAVELEPGADQPTPIEPAGVVFVATGPDDARRLLPLQVASAVDAVTDAAPTREIVTLVVDAPELDGSPRGAEVYPMPGTRRTSGLVHQTARWEWLARTAGAGTHVLSVAFDDTAGSLPTAGLSDADAATLARDEASALLGVEVGEQAVLGVHRSLFPLAPPASVLGHSDATAVARTAIAVHRGLAAVGSWLSGSGIAQVVADAQHEAERMRRTVLWGSSEAP